MSFQGHVEKGMVIMDRPLPLPDGTMVLVDRLRTGPEDFWQPMSLDELAQQQGVATAYSADELLGGWPADELNDEFEKALHDWRNRELESTT